jgi:serine/threonine protein kinase
MSPAGPTPNTSLLADQRSRWSRGERVPVEAFLKSDPGLRENTEVLLDLIYAEVVLRREAGEKPTPDEYVGRFPALADPIRTQFEVDEMMGGSTQPASDFDDPSPPPAPPGYEILQEIGRGGMGVVYKARQIALDRLVALKMIRSGEFAEPGERARFETEARAIARLSHPNVIQIYEVGTVNGRPFLALEYISGNSLADALRGPPFLPRPAATLLSRVARAIQHVHEVGVVHRDLKPANILLSSEATTKIAEMTTEQLVGGKVEKPVEPSSHSAALTPKITDFGLAKQLGSDGVTRTGDFVGTPHFAAPEQVAGRDVGPAVDVYALGAILYQMLTGRPPFTGATPLETLDQVRFSEPVPPSRLRPKLPHDLETICLTCLHKEPGRRYKTAAALADDLDRFLQGQTIRARPVRALEKAAKWCRRRPALASMIAFVILLATASLITVTALWQSEANARGAEAKARADESAERQKVEARSAELLISNARYAWTTDDVETARKALAECPDIYRTAEWAQLNRACSASRILAPPAPLTMDALSFSRDGTHLAGGYSSGKIGVWEVATGRETVVASVLHRAPLSLAYNSSGQLVGTMNAVYFSKGKSREVSEITTVDLGTASVVVRNERPDRPIRFEISGDGTKAMCISLGSRQAIVMDAVSGKTLYTLESQTGNMARGAFSADGRYLATTALPQELTVWEMSTGKKVYDLKSSEYFFGFNPIAISNDGQTVCIAVSTVARRVDLVFLHPTEPLRRFPSLLVQVNGVSFSPDGRWIACLSSSETLVRVFEAATGRQEIVCRGYPSSVQCVAFSPDSRYLATGHRDGRVVIWDLHAK